MTRLYKRKVVKLRTKESAQSTFESSHPDMFSRVQPSSRSSRPNVFGKKGVLKNFTNFAGKHLCQSLFFNKFAGH